MISRRSFLVGAGAGLIAPRMLDKFLNHLSVHNEPLIHAPKNPTNTLYVSLNDNLELCLGHLDRRTWRDILGLEDRDYWDRLRILENWRITEDQLDEEITQRAYEAWSSRDIIARRTSDLLKSLELGSDFNRPSSVGGIHFERRFGGWHSAHCDNLLSVSLLQARLNELGMGIAVEVN